MTTPEQQDQWRQAWCYMRDGGPMPDHMKRLLEDLPDYHISSFGRSRHLPGFTSSTPYRTLNDTLKRMDDNFRQQYMNTPPLTDNFRKELDNFTYQKTTPTGRRTRDPDWQPIPLDPAPARGGLVDQLRAMTQPSPQAAYADKDGHFEEWTEPLEEWDGELCLTCGASWSCDC